MKVAKIAAAPMLRSTGSRLPISAQVKPPTARTAMPSAGRTAARRVQMKPAITASSRREHRQRHDADLEVDDRATSLAARNRLARRILIEGGDWLQATVIRTFHLTFWSCVAAASTWPVRTAAPSRVPDRSPAADRRSGPPPASGRRPGRQPDMAVAERMRDVGAARRRTDAGQSIRRRGPMAHPDLHTLDAADRAAGRATWRAKSRRIRRASSSAPHRARPAPPGRPAAGPAAS